MLNKIFKSKFVLASASPRRKKLLKQIGLSFIVVPNNVPEIEDDKHPLKTIKLNAQRKCDFPVNQYKNKIIISADTVVLIDGIVLHKPKNNSQAVNFLKLLSGKSHYVYTGVCVVNKITGKSVYGYEKTKVIFRELYDEEINYYIKNYNPLDKAGAYGIQDDFGCLFIKSIVGDYYNVVGLPLVKLFQLIKSSFYIV